VVGLVRDWESELNAQGYAEGTALEGQTQLRENERDRRALEDHLGQRIEDLPRKGIFLTIHRDTLNRTKPERSDSQTPGFLIGYDYKFSDRLLAGIAGGFNVTLLDVDNIDDHESYQTYTYRLGPYFKYEWDSPWYVDGFLLGAVR